MLTLASFQNIDSIHARRPIPLSSRVLSLKDGSGWKTIHAYVGPATTRQLVEASTIPESFFAHAQWFSQARQDYVVYKLLHEKTHGYFVDLAANDAVRISNTYALEHYHDWDGLVIEPNPIYWAGHTFRKATVVAAVIGQQTGDELLFRFPKEKAPKGGLVGRQFDNKENEQNTGESKYCYTVTLRDVFDRFHVPKVIDYLSLDVEGAERFVMEAFPFDAYRVNVLTVERADDALVQLLQSHGYRQLKVLKRWGETLWIHSTMEQFIDRSALEIDTENYKYRETVAEVN